MLPRPRLFERLDAVPPASAIWVSGPAGAGKTTLLASWIGERGLHALWYQVDAGDGDPATLFHYLAQAAPVPTEKGAFALPRFSPEYLPSLETFARRFFEALFRRWPTPAVLVFDDFQEAPPDSPLKRILSAAMEAVPPENLLAILSRSRSAAGFSRHFANRRAVSIEPEALHFSIDECEGLVTLFVDGLLSHHQIHEIHHRTRGWAAGLVLGLIKNGTEVGGFPPAPQISGAIFDYFAAEILERSEDRFRDFLLLSALLSEMTAESATRMTGIPESPAILQEIYRQNFFVECREGPEPHYQYHPLFRDFLWKQAREFFSPETFERLLCRAGDILKETGGIDAAAERYSLAKAWNQLALLVLDQADCLCACGRNRTLVKWMKALPGSFFESEPRLLLWRGKARMPLDPASGRGDLETAYHHFRRQGEIAGQIACFQMIAESYFHLRDDMKSLHRWIAEGNRLAEQLGTDRDEKLVCPLAGGMLHALMLHAPGHPSVPVWIDRCHRLVSRAKDDNFRFHIAASLALFHCWRGEVSRAATLIRSLLPVSEREDIPPALHIFFQTVRCAFFLVVGKPAECRKTAEEALARGARLGIHFDDGLFYSYAAFGAIATEDLASGRGFVDCMAAGVTPEARVDMLHYHVVAAFEAYARADLAHATAEIEIAAKLDEESATPVPSALLLRFLQVRIAFERGDTKSALRRMTSLAGMARRNGCLLLEFYEFMTKADLLRVMGREEAACEYLERAFRLSRERGILGCLSWLPCRLSILCQMALEAGIETEQVLRFIRRNRLRPLAPLSAGPEWPWPVRIFLLGRMAWERSDAEPSAGGKKARKSLELLFLLACRGPAGISREEAADTLWPETDGDRARQNIDTAVHRLRRMVGSEAAVIAADGRLALSAECCWVDAWHFEWLIDRADGESDVGRKRSLLEKALGLYGGPVPEEINEIAPCFSFWERISAQWRHGTLALVSLLEACGEQGGAIRVCMKALALDDTAEPVYQALMSLLADNGRASEALRVFERCQNALSRKLGAAPGPEMKALYRQIRSARAIS